MKGVVLKSLVKDMRKAIIILEAKGTNTAQELKKLSDHTIEDVALYKNLDAVSLAVLIYSLHKTIHCLDDTKYGALIKEMKHAANKLDSRNLGAYNQGLKRIFEIVKTCNTQIKTHIQDVFHAARIHKGTTLLEHGISTARAAQVMGISRWELTEYIGKRRVLSEAHEKISVSKRMQHALNLFNTANQQDILFFDAGPLISLTMSRLLWILEPLKSIFGGKFYITPAVFEEVITKPAAIKRFAYESLEIQKLIKEGIIEIYSGVSKKRVTLLTSLSNKLFSVNNGKWLEIIQAGEMETVVATQKLGSKTIVMDERTMRLLIEDCVSLKSLLERRSRKKVDAHKDTILKFTQSVGKVPIIRSIELASVAYYKGLLDPYLPQGTRSREILIGAVLWNTKYNGCAVTEHEIEELTQFLLKKK